MGKFSFVLAPGSKRQPAETCRTSSLKANGRDPARTDGKKASEEHPRQPDTRTATRSKLLLMNGSDHRAHCSLQATLPAFLLANRAQFQPLSATLRFLRTLRRIGDTYSALEAAQEKQAFSPSLVRKRDLAPFSGQWRRVSAIPRP